MLHLIFPHLTEWQSAWLTFGLANAELWIMVILIVYGPKR